MGITTASMLLWLLSCISALGVAVLAWSLNSKTTKDKEERDLNRLRDDRINALEKAFITAENTFVTNTQLKLAIKEAFEPYKEDNQEIKAMLKSVSEELVNISRDLAVINAIGRSNHRTRDDGSDGGGLK